MSEVGSKPQNKVTETDAHLLICLAAQLALEDCLVQMQEGNDPNLRPEATWFMKIAWNLALESTDNSLEMQKLFLFCCKKGLLRQCLDHVEACRALRKRIDESVTLLAMYEFEAKAHLGDNNLSECLDMVEAMPHTDPNTFETLAALAVESPVYHRDLGMRSLRIAIKKRLAMDVIDFTKLSKAFHSLVDLALNNGSSSDAESKEEALTIYQDICDIIENRAKGCYPELQILWLMTKAWNCGIHLFSSSKQEAGEKWCAVALKLLHHLPTFKCNYQEKVATIAKTLKDTLSEVSSYLEKIKASPFPTEAYS
ncbi:Testis-expressed protein 11 [Acropora cervicornis]|uniref:Testis-expressed protein 11 n=1 Tax=Acropora cervicornis TaxID=6130 RepID=A0AAD9PWB0_ACRCE|nr:Testis-expressed protein 11 [Acropora cervicornis]